MRANLQIKAPPRFLFMGLLVLLVGTYIGLLVSSPSSVEDYSEHSDPKTATPTRPVKYDIERIAKIFGTPQQEKTKSIEVKESALSLKLVASYAVGENGRSAAVLEQSGGKQRLYFSGDLVMPGVTLKAVEARRILIQRDQTIEQITLISLQSYSNKETDSIDLKSISAPPQVEVTSIVEGSAELDAMLDALRSLPPSNDKGKGTTDSPAEAGNAF